MSRYTKLPEDYPVDALSLEAQRRGKAMGRQYSYGQLVADTTPEQREKIAEEYKENFRRKGNGSSHSAFGKTDQDTVAKIRRKSEEREVED